MTPPSAHNDVGAQDSAPSQVQVPSAEQMPEPPEIGETADGSSFAADVCGVSLLPLPVGDVVEASAPMGLSAGVDSAKSRFLPKHAAELPMIKNSTSRHRML
jgi:hypothetical protein